jgi:hypothetical protein
MEILTVKHHGCKNTYGNEKMENHQHQFAHRFEPDATFFYLLG